MKWIKSIKPLLIIAVLGVVAYGVWVRISGPPSTEPPDAKGWEKKLIIKDVPPVGPMSSDKVPAPGDYDSNALPPLYNPSQAPPEHGSHGNHPPGNVPKVIPEPDPPRVHPGGSSNVNHHSHSGPNKSVSAGGPTFFSTNLASAEEMLANHEFKRALNKLSSMYGSNKLSEQEHLQLIDLLDQVAGTVIYSRKCHRPEDAHIVAVGETLETIAHKYDVPAGLLAKINGIKHPAALRVGEKLKVVRGPFNARLDMNRGEITLMLGRIYAGRFPCRIANAGSFVEGNYSIEKSYPPRQLLLTSKKDGASIPIISTNDPYSGIQLNPNHLDDIYDILSERSRFIIRR